MSQDTGHNPDFEQAVEDIASQFYPETQDENDAHPLGTYLTFSEVHSGSERVILGVLALLSLIVLVWGIIWYQTLQDVTLVSANEADLITDVSTDFEEIFAEIQADQAQASQLTREATLKSELAGIIQKERAILGTTTTTAITTTTTNSTTTPETL
jgi:hypothetical protein